MPIKIATWNVNSISIRLQQAIDVMNQYHLDVLGLQETKVIDNNFPIDAFHEAGFSVLFNGQKSYNGTAYISRKPLQNAYHYLPGMQTDYQRRFLQADWTTENESITLINCYVPNGKAVGDEKYNYKLAWLDALIAHLQALLNQDKSIILMGDFNIAPQDRDVYDPDYWRDKILCSPPERERLAKIEALGFRDAFRQFNDEAEQYSWWDYREGGFQRNKGHRIDLILTSDNLTLPCTDCVIEKTPRGWERPSDHTPVIATFADT